MNAPATTAIPAATLVILRESADHSPELLMIERARGMVFAGGALVFPGGRIDPGDHGIAANAALLRSGASLDPEDAAARVAAIRETIEEVGIAVALDPMPTVVATAELRTALAQGDDFGLLLAAGEYRLDLDRLTYFARWRPNFTETRVFDTRFYVAAAPADAVAEADGGESVHAAWYSAAAAIAEADAGNRRVIFPTRRNLERLARFATLDEAIADAARHPVLAITPWIEDRAGEPWLCIPEDSGYPITAETLETARRG